MCLECEIVVEDESGNIGRESDHERAPVSC